jgi:hypothetical protein
MIDGINLETITAQSESADSQPNPAASNIAADEAEIVIAPKISGSNPRLFREPSKYI